MSKTVLIVDDEQLILRMVARSLQRSGWEVFPAHAAQVPTLLDDNEFDLLITDSQMPGMDGREVIAEARERKPDLPVVLMSGFSPHDLSESGPHYFLQKPFSVDDLEFAVAQALQGEPFQDSVM